MIIKIGINKKPDRFRCLKRRKYGRKMLWGNRLYIRIMKELEYNLFRSLLSVPVPKLIDNWPKNSLLPMPNSRPNETIISFRRSKV